MIEEGKKYMNLKLRDQLKEKLDTLDRALTDLDTFFGVEMKDHMTPDLLNFQESCWELEDVFCNFLGNSDIEDL